MTAQQQTDPESRPPSGTAGDDDGFSPSRRQLLLAGGAGAGALALGGAGWFLLRGGEDPTENADVFWEALYTGDLHRVRTQIHSQNPLFEVEFADDVWAEFIDERVTWQGIDGVTTVTTEPDPDEIAALAPAVGENTLERLLENEDAAIVETTFAIEEADLGEETFERDTAHVTEAGEWRVLGYESILDPA